MDKVSKVLKGRLGKKGLMGAATSAHICFLAGKWARGRLVPIAYSKGVLKVSVMSSAQAQEMSMKEEEICDYINEKLERKNCVKRIRIVNIQ